VSFSTIEPLCLRFWTSSLNDQTGVAAVLSDHRFRGQCERRLRFRRFTRASGVAESVGTRSPMVLIAAPGSARCSGCGTGSGDP
jgi:hypothetical protein